ncbi:CapA family protein [Streptacidiphilus sp. P02-A3a]|uniref:CapA family protein n=1 Tax=Streptacidiphilus sp. P02-A3a TaxID=2704468 RepID=UPI001CDD7B76|nr:CapA family protein [Streptacidiphilus sp. P02-A3a]
MALGGDWMATRGSVLADSPRAQALRTLLTSADFSFANLEVVAADWQGHPVRDPLGSTLATGARVLDDLRDAGIDMVSFANNHALDMGTEGLLAQLRELRSRGLAVAGAGPELTSARMPAYVDRPGGSAALIACTASFGPGQEAAATGLQLPGRPGVSPLRHQQVLEVTEEQLAVLRRIDRETGLAAQRAGIVAMIGSDPWSAEADPFPFLGGLFRAAAAPGLRTSVDEQDLAGILLWVREARQRSDLVVVSVHSHESGPSPLEPAAFLRAFAHAAIEAGADMVVGHGPHRLRGIEVHRGRPIFYSLGNLVSQIELTQRLPAEDYAKVPSGRPLSPFGFFNARSLADTRGFATGREYWETVVPVVTAAAPAAADGRYRPSVVELHPVTLGFGLPTHRRGRPACAAPEDGRRILAELAELSAGYGTVLELAEGPTGPIGRLPLS